MSIPADTGAVEVEVYGEGANSHPEDYGITWYEHDFPRSGMFVLNHVLVRVAYGRGLNVLAVNPRTLEYEFRVSTAQDLDPSDPGFGRSDPNTKAAWHKMNESLPLIALILEWSLGLGLSWFHPAHRLRFVVLFSLIISLCCALFTTEIKPSWQQSC